MDLERFVEAQDEHRTYTQAVAELRAEIVAGHQDKTAEQIFSWLDAMKLRSSMTLFAAADPEQPAYTAVLEKFFAGPDPETLRRI